MSGNRKSEIREIALSPLPCDDIVLRTIDAMDRIEIIKRWKVARSNLEHARQFLPLDLIENSGAISDHDLATLKKFDEYLKFNELELALDELVGLGELNNCRGGFWRELERAADVMKLHSKAAALHQRFLTSLDSQADRKA